MSVSRYVPKFKNYGTSMSLDTRVRCVIGSHNMGYTTYYKTLLCKLGCLEENDDKNCHISSGISRIGKAKSSNKEYKQQVHVKRKRKYGQLAKTKQQLFEEGVDRARKLGTYETGVAILGQQDDTQQSSNSNPKQQQKQRKNMQQLWQNRSQDVESAGMSQPPRISPIERKKHHKHRKSSKKTCSPRHDQKSGKKSEKKIGDHGDDVIGGEMVVDDFGVVISKNEATLMVRGGDVAPSSTKNNALDENIFLGNNNEKTFDARNVSPHCTGSTESNRNCTSSCTKRTDNIDSTVRTSTTVQQSSIDDHISTSVQNLRVCIPVYRYKITLKKKLVRTYVRMFYKSSKKYCTKFHSSRFQFSNEYKTMAMRP